MPSRWSDKEYKEFLKTNFPHIKSLEPYQGSMSRTKHRCGIHKIVFHSTQNNFAIAAKKKSKVAGCPKCVAETKFDIKSVSVKGAAAARLSKEEYESRLRKKFRSSSPQVLKFNGITKPAKVKCTRCNTVFTKSAGLIVSGTYPCACLRQDRFAFSKIDIKGHDTIQYLYESLLFNVQQISELTGVSPMLVAKSLRARGLGTRESKLKQKRGLSIYSTGVGYREYKRLTMLITNQVYKAYQEELDPKNKRGNEFHLDHVRSIVDCYRDQLPLKVVTHPANLKLITAKQNLVKNRKSKLSLSKLKKKIRLWESQHGKFVIPEVYDEFVFEKRENSKKRFRVLGLDPGTSSYAYTMADLGGVDRIDAVRIVTRGMVENTIKSFGDNFSEQVENHKQEIRNLIERHKPDLVIFERYQARGMKGITIELVNLMIGILVSLTEETRLPIKGIMPSTWKNAVNRKFDLKELYSLMPKAKQHNLDALLIACYGFPGDSYSFFIGKEERLKEVFYPEVS